MSLDYIERHGLPDNAPESGQRQAPSPSSHRQSYPSGEVMFDADDPRRLENGSQDSRSVSSADEDSDGDDVDDQTKPLRVKTSFDDGPFDSSDDNPKRRHRPRSTYFFLSLFDLPKPVFYASAALLITFLGITVFIADRITKTSLQGEDIEYRQKLLSTLQSNGSMLFAPTTIVVSLDGFRPDLMSRGLTPTLANLVAEPDTLSPEYMTPSFPSLTFPNHYTLVTGLYPESHGIVANAFWDSSFKERFSSHSPITLRQARWWGGDPIWRTAERQDVRTAILMWPGSIVRTRAGGLRVPTFVDEFAIQPLQEKVDRALMFLDMPGPEPNPEFFIKSNQSEPVDELDEYSFPTSDAFTKPQLITLYVPDIDTAGHSFGPNSTEMNSALESADLMVATLLHGIQVRNLTSIVNVVILSDHGMATTSSPNNHNQTIQIKDLLDPNKDLAHRHPDGAPHAGLWPATHRDPKDLAEKVKANLEKVLPDGHKSAVKVYLRDEDMPVDYHFSANKDRIAPVWIMPDPGWSLIYPDDDVKDLPNGLHGYDHRHPLMRSIFIGTGPAFNRSRILEDAQSGKGPVQNLNLSPNASSPLLRPSPDKQADHVTPDESQRRGRSIGLGRPTVRRTHPPDFKDASTDNRRIARSGVSGGTQIHRRRRAEAREESKPDKSFIGSVWDSIVDGWNSLFSGGKPGDDDDSGDKANPNPQGGPGDDTYEVGDLNVLIRPRPFQNVNVYNLLCESLGVIPSPNNGTLSIRDLVVLR